VEYLKDTAEAGMPESVPDAIAGEDGRFSLDSLPMGEYLLEARDGDGNAVARYLSVSSRFTGLPSDTLRRPGILEGRLERMGNVSQRAFARFYGLDRVVEADSTGHYAVNDLPAGQYRIQGVSSLPGYGFQKPAPVLIYPESTSRLPTLPLIRSVDEDYAQWPFSRQLFLSTDSVPPGEIVRDFPLLVRLDAGNFDFGQSTGSDIRFSAADGRHLAYEVERWDAANRQAEIWVRLDSIPGGAPFSLMMHWGRLQAPDFSFGATVFSGFGGVWHLQAISGFYGEALFPDASPGGAHLAGWIDSWNRSGAIGVGAGFRGIHALVGTGNPGLWPDTGFTISAWIQVTDLPSTGIGVLSLGDDYVLRIEPTGAVRFFYYNDTLMNSEPTLGPWVDVTTPQKVNDKSWHQVAAILSGDSLRLSIDGEPRAAVRARGPVTYGRGTDLFVGVHGGLEKGFRFNGQIDEVRVSGRSRSRAWMKLTYETQKPGASALTFR
jgi:hypothetical protein